jgi:hypothetical protein
MARPHSEGRDQKFPRDQRDDQRARTQNQSGLRSMKQKEPVNKFEDKEEEATTHPIRPTIKQNDIFIKIYDVEDNATGLIYSDQTGCFPRKSSRGNQYIMVLAHIDAILAEPMKNHTAREMIKVYQALLDRLQTAGVVQKRHILDNKCSEEFKATIRKNKMTFQLVPPHDHRINIAEKAIQTFKAHFISILCGTDITFLLHLWCRLLRQSEHTLNMLRHARITPTVSAYAYLWGQHDYNANPFAPLGCKVEAHVTPEVRETWAPHTTSGYYIGNAEEHYRCHKIYISNTKSERICETVFFKHKYLTMPTIAPAEAILKAADNLVDTICNRIPKNSATADAVEKLMEVFKIQAEKATCKAAAQRVLRERAFTKRVDTEALATVAVPTTPLPELEVEYPDTTEDSPSNIPVILQDDDNAPAANTQSQQQNRTLTQDYMLHMMEITGYTAPFTARQAASRQYPL